MSSPTSTWKEIARFMNGEDRAAVPALSRPALRLARPLASAVRKFIRDRSFEQAAGLAFVTIVSMIPAGVLLVFFMKAFGLQAYWGEFRQAILDNLVEGTFKQDLAGWLGEVEKDPLSTRIGTPLFVFAVGALIFTAVWLLEASERAFNFIWRTARKRSRLQRFMVFWSVLTASPFLLALSSVLKSRFESHEVIADLIQASVFFRTLYSLCLPVLVATFAFFFLYLLLPATRVKPGPALAGAVLAGLFWELAKAWMSYTIPRAVTISLYGSLGAIAVFFVWLYVAWAVILLGAQLSFTVQNPREAFALLAARAASFQAPPGLVAVAAALQIARASAAGAKAPTIDSLAERWSCPREIIPQALDPFVPAYFHPSLADDDVYYLSRDSDQVLLRDLLGAGITTASRHGDCFKDDAIADLLVLLETGIAGSLGDLSVRDLVRRNLSLRASDNPQRDSN